MTKRNLWNERYAKKDLVWSAGPNQFFAAEVKNLSPGRSLDVACGEGRNAIWLAEQGWQSTAIDFSDLGIEKAKEIAEKRGVKVNWIADDVCNFALTKETYDLVAVLYLHTSKTERLAWLPNVLASIKPSGTLIYIAHDPSNVAHGVGGPQDLSLLPSVEELTREMLDFKIEVAKVIERPVANDPGHGKALTGIALDSFIRAVKAAP
jgi:SAM-dependent methyltransferase